MKRPALLLLSLFAASACGSPSGVAGSGGTAGSAGAGGEGGGAAGEGGSGGNGGTAGASGACDLIAFEGGVLDVAWEGERAFRPRLVRAGASFVLLHGAGAETEGDAAIHAVVLPDGPWNDGTLPAGALVAPTGGRSFVAASEPDDTHSIVFATDEASDLGAPKESGWHLVRGLGAGAPAAPVALDSLTTLGHALVVAPFQGGTLVGLRDAATAELRLAKVSAGGTLEGLGSIACSDGSFPSEFQPWAAAALPLASGEVLVAHACSPSGSAVPLSRVGASGVFDTGDDAGVGLQNEVALIPNPKGGGWIMSQSAVAFYTSDWFSALDHTGGPKGEPEQIPGILTIQANGRIAAAPLGGGLALALVVDDALEVTRFRGGEWVKATLAPPGSEEALVSGVGEMDVLAAPDGEGLVIAWTDVQYAESQAPPVRHLRVARVSCE